MKSIIILSDICTCGHWNDDHHPECTVAEDDIDCRCIVFTSNDNDFGYWFTDDQGNKLEGTA